MDRVALIKPDGLINHSFLPDRPYSYTAGQVIDGLIVQFFPETEDPVSWVTTKFWDFSESSWSTLPTKPDSIYYVWSQSAKNYVLDREAFEESVRVSRNKKLNDSDWYLLPDAPITDTFLLAIKTYRQELRDFPSTIDFDTIEDITTISWPVKPTE